MVILDYTLLFPSVCKPHSTRQEVEHTSWKNSWDGKKLEVCGYTSAEAPGIVVFLGIHISMPFIFVFGVGK